MSKLKVNGNSSTPPTQPYFQLRRSRIHGLGAFAVRPIPKGTRIIEYTGEHITNAQADRRANPENPSHTVLFILNKRTVIDAAVGGNEAQYINHSCAPNCDAKIMRGHIYIVALRDIAVGEELSYDYKLETDGRITAAKREQFACRCGAPNCRGTMLLLKSRPRAGTAHKRSAK